jgi:hypothetical protein
LPPFKKKHAVQGYTGIILNYVKPLGTFVQLTMSFTGCQTIRDGEVDEVWVQRYGSEDVFIVCVALDQQGYVMDDKHSEHHGKEAPEEGHVEASQGTVGLAGPKYTE